MKPLFSLTLTLAGLSLLADCSLAQPPEGGPRPPRNNQEQGPGRRPEENRGQFRPPASPLVEALDADKDGVISAEEIQNAVAALKSLDKNNDGKLSQEEIRPQFRGPRPEGGPEEGNRPPRPAGDRRPGGPGEDNPERPARPPRPSQET